MKKVALARIKAEVASWLPPIGELGVGCIFYAFFFLFFIMAALLYAIAMIKQ